MIAQWLRAGVVENGQFSATEAGTPQGGVISPVLLNVALHGMEQAAGGSLRQVRHRCRTQRCRIPNADQIRR
jgi:RNA-directed DNA polymerase